ncbi:MAG TPA: VOC family protein [Chloroflexota bacterium]|jgi:glyoxylase I family protein|nr:VOC family protein [Chloroflexota bacterium]
MAITGEERQTTAVPAPALVGTLHEGIPVRDLEAALRFYREVLGLQVLPRPNLPAPGVWLGYPEGGPQIHLIVSDDYVPGPEARISPTGRHTAFAVADLDALRARLRQLGIPYQEITGLVGSDQVFIRDPDGHTLEFQQAP